VAVIASALEQRCRDARPDRVEGSAAGDEGLCPARCSWLGLPRQGKAENDRQNGLQIRGEGATGGDSPAPFMGGKSHGKSRTNLEGS